MWFYALYKENCKPSNKRAFESKEIDEKKQKCNKNATKNTQIKVAESKKFIDKQMDKILERSFEILALGEQRKNIIKQWTEDNPTNENRTWEITFKRKQLSNNKTNPILRNSRTVLKQRILKSKEKNVVQQAPTAINAPLAPINPEAEKRKSIQHSMQNFIVQKKQSEDLSNKDASDSESSTDAESLSLPNSNSKLISRNSTLESN